MPTKYENKYTKKQAVQPSDPWQQKAGGARPKTPVKATYPATSHVHGAEGSVGGLVGATARTARTMEASATPPPRSASEVHERQAVAAGGQTATAPGRVAPLDFSDIHVATPSPEPPPPMLLDGEQLEPQPPPPLLTIGSARYASASPATQPEAFTTPDSGFDPSTGTYAGTGDDSAPIDTMATGPIHAKAAAPGTGTRRSGFSTSPLNAKASRPNARTVALSGDAGTPGAGVTFKVENGHAVETERKAPPPKSPSTSSGAIALGLVLLTS